MDSRNATFLSQIQKWIDAANPEIFSACCSTLVTACMRCDMYQQGVCLFKEALSGQKDIASASNSVFGYLIRHNNVEEVVNILNSMYRTNFLPPSTICSSLLQYLSNQQRWQEAYELLTRVAHLGKPFALHLEIASGTFRMLSATFCDAH